MKIYILISILSLLNNYRGSSNSYYSRTSEIPIEKKNPSIIFFESESWALDFHLG